MEREISAYVNSVFEQPWWLEVVAPNAWKEILVEENCEIIARWPIVIKGNRITMPKLTQTLGFWLSDSMLDSDPYYNKRKKTINLLLEQFPRNKNINILLDPNVNYFLPLLWKYYSINPRITYRIRDLANINAIYERFHTTVKRHIRSANNKVIVKTIDDIEILLMLMDKTFSKQNRKYPISKDLVRNIYCACKNHNAEKLLYAIDNNGNVHSGVLFVYDKKICYYLIAGSDPKYRSSGANSLLIWEGIKFASTVSESFDFEGSIIEGIENFFRSFGGTPLVYYEIHKQNNISKALEMLKTILKSFVPFKQ
jgi:hypothetical protein